MWLEIRIWKSFIYLLNIIGSWSASDNNTKANDNDIKSSHINEDLRCVREKQMRDRLSQVLIQCQRRWRSEHSRIGWV